MLISAIGVTVVQYRDKTSDTKILVETASKLHAITKAYGVPLIINDRVDIALAVGAEGVHLGQDDMSKLCLGFLRLSLAKSWKPSMLQGSSFLIIP